MSLIITCPACRAESDVPDTAIGTLATCDRCGAEALIPPPIATRTSAIANSSPAKPPAATPGERLAPCTACQSNVAPNAYWCPACGTPVRPLTTVWVPLMAWLISLALAGALIASCIRIYDR